MRWAAATLVVLALGFGPRVTIAGPATLPAVKPTAKTDTCVNEACHSGILAHKVLHGPVAQKKCSACHEYLEPRDHSFRLASAPEQLCRDCHTLQTRTVVHAPIADGRCGGCHDPHGSAHPAMLLADPTRGLCLTCHKQDLTDKKFVHGPVNSGACILCHEPHSSWQANLLTDTPQKLCIGCHSELIARGDETRHIHAPLKDNCGACHDAHASDLKFQLHQPAAELCTTCHKDVAEAMASSPVVHGAATEGEGCLGCHAPHFSKLAKLQKQTQPDACVSCHDKPLKDSQGKPLTDFAALLKDNPQQHGPIRDGACTACHQPHAGDQFRLLVASYPPEFYAPFKLEQYALCFSCHIPELVLQQKGSGLTRFRSGEQNLHWLHVNQEKGRTCRACHEVHASRHPFHMRDAVPFGDKGWMLEINYEQTATGGRCSPGCHGPKEYDHGGSPRPPTTQEGAP